MRHYEVVFIIHPNQFDEVKNIIKKYKSIITTNNGLVHRLEDWGHRQLAYPINKINKAYYVLLNIEVTQELIVKLRKLFHLNNAIIRSMIVRVKNAVKESSPMIKLDIDSNNDTNLYNKKSKKI